MKSFALVLLLAIFACQPARAAEVLIVADEFPAMEELARQLQQQEGVASRLVRQTNLPLDLAPFSTVIVYIHGKLLPEPESAMENYTRGGGKLVALHHSISSGKRTNSLWFPFLGVDLPKGSAAQGGYQWTEGVTMGIANLAPAHFITTNKIKYEALIPFADPAAGGRTNLLPGFILHETEVYLNHRPPADRTRLLGLQYQDAKTGKVWMQDHAGWCRKEGKGWICYLLPGHSVREFQNPAYARMVINAVIFQP